jgi:triacylglycerol lipase
MKNPILFIHGFGGGKYEYQPVIRFLKKHSNPVCYEFVYKDKFGQSSMKLIAEDLHKYIVKNIPEQELDIIGFSQGGIIARYYISHYSDKKINKCITLCTPHSGSLMAYVGFFPGIKELQPNSLLLKDLDTGKAEYYAVYNPLDLFVFPGWHAKFKFAKENKRVFALLHQLTFWNKRTLNFISSVLEKTN